MTEYYDGGEEDYPPRQRLPPIVTDAYSRNLIRDLLDPSDVITAIEMNLKGFKITTNGKGDEVWQRDANQKVVKEEGVSHCIGLLRDHLPKMQTLANLENTMILRMMRHFCVQVAGMMYMKQEDFTYEGNIYNQDEPDYALMDRVFLLLHHNVYCNLTRAKNGAENRLLRTVYKSVDTGVLKSREIETSSTGGGNFFSKFFPKKRQGNFEEEVVK